MGAWMELAYTMPSKGIGPCARESSNLSAPTIAPWCNISAIGFEPIGSREIRDGVAND